MRKLLLFLLVLCSVAADGQPAPVSFEYYQSLIFVRVAVNGKKNLRFLFNTGANASVIDTRTAATLKLAASTPDSVVGTVGREAVDRLVLSELALGPVSVRRMPVTRRDLGSYLTPDNARLDGVLGTDFLARYAVSIDYGKKQLRFAAPGAGRQAAKSGIAFTMIDGTPTVRARLNDTLEVPLRYNSGVSLAPDATISINVSDALWRELKKRNPRLAPARHLAVRGVGGAAYLPVVPVTGLDLDRFRVLQPNLVVQPEGGYFERNDIAGFFGNNLLEKFQKITLDFPAGVLRVEPLKSYGAYLYERKAPAPARKPGPKGRKVAAR